MKKMRKMEVGTLVVVLHSQNQKVCILSVSDLQRTNFASIKGFVQSYKLICIFFFENMKGRPNSLVLFLRTKPHSAASICTIQEV